MYLSHISCHYAHSNPNYNGDRQFALIRLADIIICLATPLSMLMFSDC